jgi:hypothetical protein
LELRREAKHVAETIGDLQAGDKKRWPLGLRQFRHESGHRRGERGGDNYWGVAVLAFWRRRTMRERRRNRRFGGFLGGWLNIGGTADAQHDAGEMGCLLQRQFPGLHQRRSSLLSVDASVDATRWLFRQRVMNGEQVSVWQRVKYCCFSIMM